MKIAVACGGTGGHIFPGLAVATLLVERGHDVTLWLSGRNVEQTTVDGWTGRTVFVRSKGFNRGAGLGVVGTVVRLIAAVRTSRKEMASDRPDVLLAMGSYTSVGPVLAARSLRVPVVLHEGNAVPGRAISFLKRFAAVVAVSWQESSLHLGNTETAVTGFPLRPDLFEQGGAPLFKQDLFTVLVMGGSLGAHRLNEIASDALCLLKSRGEDFQVLHLSGQADEEELRLTYEQAGVRAHVMAFFGEMGRAYRAADIAVCRAGGASCAELAACGVPSLLVPLPGAPRDHQAANAEVLVRAGGAVMRRQHELTAAWLAELLAALERDRQRLEQMAVAMRSVAAPDAARRLANLVEETA